MSRRLTTDEFINKAIAVHGTEYDYSLVNYKNTETVIDINCSMHGVFKQRPSVHLRGHKCPTCSGGGCKLSNEEFTNRAVKIYGNTYDYSLVNYKNFQTKVEIICKEHGVFNGSPMSHLINGSGCKKCRHIVENKDRYGIYTLSLLNRRPDLANKSATLYLIEHNGLYKVGVTLNSVHKRFFKKVKCIKEIKNIPLIDAFIKEQIILLSYNKFRQHPEDWKYAGNTEFLRLDEEQVKKIINEFYN